MPILHCYVDEDVERFMRVMAALRHVKVEQLAEAAIENAAIEAGYRRESEANLRRLNKISQG